MSIADTLRNTAPIDMPLALLLEAADELDRLTGEWQDKHDICKELRADLKKANERNDSLLSSNRSLRKRLAGTYSLLALHGVELESEDL
jgi:hypothetical protein